MRRTRPPPLSRSSFCDLLLGQGRRRWRGVCRVGPAQCVFVMEGDLRVSGLRFGPGAARLDARRPVGSAGGKALVLLSRLVVDLADRVTEPESLGLECDARLVHLGRTVYVVTGEPDACLRSVM